MKQDLGAMTMSDESRSDDIAHDESDLKTLLQRRYDYVVIRDGDKYTVVINDLSLITSGEDLGECIAVIDRKKDELLSNFAQMKRANYVPLPGSSGRSNGRTTSIETFRAFVGRSAMLAFIIVVGMGICGVMFASQLRPYFHYTYVREMTSRVAAAIAEDFGRPKGEDWELAMENLRKGQERYREVVDILTEKSMGRDDSDEYRPARSEKQPGERERPFRNRVDR